MKKKGGDGRKNCKAPKNVESAIKVELSRTDTVGNNLWCGEQALLEYGRKEQRGEDKN